MDKTFNVIDGVNDGVDTILPKIHQAIQSNVASSGGAVGGQNFSRVTLGMESYDSVKHGQMATVVTDLRQMISTVRNNLMASDKSIKLDDLSVAQEKAAVIAGMAAGNIRDYMKVSVPSRSEALAKTQGRDFSFVAEDSQQGVGFVNRMDALRTVSGKSLGMEAYDERENANAVTNSVVYNMEASRQDPFGEAHFPTIVSTHDSVGMEVRVRLNFVQEDVRHAINGALTDFKRTNILKALVRPGIFRNDQTKMIPVVVADGGENDTTASFVAPSLVAPYDVPHDGKTRKTAPLVIGKKLNVLGLSQNPDTLAAGQFDTTDAIDSSVRLAAIYVVLPAAGNKVVAFPTLHLPAHEFNAAVQGLGRQLQLSMITSDLVVTKNTRAYDGSVIADLAALNDNKVNLHAYINGYLIQDRGETVVDGKAISVDRITALDKSLLDLKTGAGKTIADLFAGAEVVGYDLLAFRTNSNRRQRGQLLDTQVISQLYTVPLLPPITALRPLSETEANDSARLQDLITATKIRTSNAAVGALLENISLIKSIYSMNDDTLRQPEVLGAARFLVDLCYREEELKVDEELNSLNSDGRVEDVEAVIATRLRYLAADMYLHSALGVARDVLLGTGAGKPLVIIGCDPFVAQWLVRVGDQRLMGDQFEFRVATTYDERMRGKITLTFGDNSAYNSQAVCFLHFGSMIWRPELTVMMPMPRNGGISHEMTVAPSFRHICNLPVAALVHISGIEKVLGKSVPVRMLNVTP